MEEITTSEVPVPTKRLTARLGRRARTLAALVVMGTMLGAGIAATTGTAGAAVAYTSVSAEHHLGNCNIWSGDYANSPGVAIGDTTISCSSYHPIAAYTYLYRNGVLVAQSGEAYYSSTSYIGDVVTASINTAYYSNRYTTCNSGRAVWQTASQVWIGTSGWWTFWSNQGTYNPCVF